MRRLVVALAFAGLALPAVCLADDEDSPEEQTGRLVAVQTRRFWMKHELTLHVGALPMDAFYKGVATSLSYTWHFSERWGWEVIHAGYSQNFDTGLRDELQNQFGVNATQFPELQIYGTSGFNWAPVYGKLAIFNRKLIHAEGFLCFGAGAAYVGVGRAHLLAPEGYLGGGLRVFFTPSWSMRFDVRDGILLSAARAINNKQVLFLGFAASYNMGAD
jgi:outer membrane beta-barrel protein